MAANFIGWVFTISLAELSPVAISIRELSKPKLADTTILRLASSNSRLLIRYQALTPMTKIAASTKPEVIVCRNLLTAVGESRTSQKLVISLRAISGLNFVPTGFCIQELAKIGRAAWRE